MTLTEAVGRVQKIEHVKEDDERAHAMEDSLRADFVRHVAEVGNKSLREIALEILKTEQIVFGRWCA